MAEYASYRNTGKASAYSMSSLSVAGTTKEGVPVLILKEGASHAKGKDAIRNNVEAAKLVAAIIKSVLGPRGLDKLLVNSVGDVTITDDGATIHKEMDVQHPAAKIMVESTKTEPATIATTLASDFSFLFSIGSCSKDSSYLARS